VIRAARRFVGRGRVVHRNADLASLEASLSDVNGSTIATATATARVIPLAQARAGV
jgi:acyl-coenzyme A thioesterase PaaI-like protein